MPYTRLDKKKNEELAVLINGYIYKFDGNLKIATEKTGISRNTLSRRLSKPGDFTIDELLNIGRKYHIPIEDLRAAIRY